ncbi:MAG: magnesium chelatase subunit H [Gemmatimonadota bacterium]|jgi:magnesium chelatase subunit H|nr:magnesium chelatase subunit H [Gemmatimonadota bacterium]
MATSVVQGPELRFVIVTLDAHLAGAFETARRNLVRQVPALKLEMHVAAEWDTDPAAAERARQAIGRAHCLAITQIFTEEGTREILEAVRARRDAADAVLCALCTSELMQNTKLGKFSMAAKDNGPFSLGTLLRKLRGKREEGRSSGERQMHVLRTLPKLLRFIPGTAQDVRAYFLLLQYWLAGSDTNIEQMVRYCIDRFAAGERTVYRGALKPGEPEEYPEVGVWHPDLPKRGIAADRAALPARGTQGAVGVMVGRSYLLAGNTRHYAAVVRALEARGLDAVPVFASALDGRPALDAFCKDAQGRPTIDALVNLTGFSLVGGPAYNDAPAAQCALAGLDVPYASLQTLEFQTIDEWRADARGLNPLQATLQVAIPELDGATLPLVYGGKGKASPEVPAPESVPIADRVEVVADRVARWVRLRRTPRDRRKVAVILFNFPPNAGNTGSAAYLNVFASLQRTLAAMKEAGYRVDLPRDVDELRAAVCDGNREQYGAPANVHTVIPADRHVATERYLAEIEATWGPAPGKQLTDGRGLFVMGRQFGHVFVGVQPSFGWEGDPMRLLFEGNFAPTHAFSAFYRWLRDDYGADVVLHFGTHGALEFMPGKQAGLSGDCWPERLIRDLPNVYLYASNNSSEGTLAKRRGGATLVSYLTPPIANSGLYKGLADLKAALDRYRAAEAEGERATLAAMLQAQGAALDLCAAEPAWPAEGREPAVARLRERLLEIEYSLIPVGLHVVGEGMTPEERRGTLRAFARNGRPEADLPSLVDAIKGMATTPDVVARAEAAADKAVDAIVEKGSAAWGRDAIARDGWARHTLAMEGSDLAQIGRCLDDLARIDAMLREDTEVPGILRALDGRYVPPAPGGDLLRMPQVLPTGRNVYGFDPYRVPSAYAMLEGKARTEQLLARVTADGAPLPETVAFVLWGTDNMKSEGTPLAQVMALMGVAPRFDGVGRLCGARLIPLEQLKRPRIDVVVTLSGIFRDLLPLQVKLLAEAALLCAKADEPEALNFVRKHTREHMERLGVDLETAALRVYSNADGAYGSNVNLLVETGRFEDEDELADQFVQRKAFAYGVKGTPRAQAALMKRQLAGASVAFQNIDSVELGATDIDQYVESLGGLNRVITKERGAEVAVYMGDFTGEQGKVRTLREQVELESRNRMLNPRWYEAQIANGYEGVRNLAGHLTATFGWSATGGTDTVPQFVYTEVTQTFVLDTAMREKLATLNPNAAVAIAQRLLEANDRGYWRPSQDMLDRLRDATAELEDRLEGVYAG